ncbi:Mur ligase domain-containing protein [Kitasatospora phosalacinea]|uniref:UDP-N-acetylmuramate--L-alanine ligase n=1 Tax=Kitasatospora phosalacinea TaxID=2065 RepID=A0A9W6PLU0_9ACTN|nr:Mur ligase domain-containing protein [Kitasatospora phosalacinea]GLW58749.1 UDP-N-acetylmuramate--L-alanine ligase [Kitasatospora phosalacinea]
MATAPTLTTATGAEPDPADLPTALSAVHLVGVIDPGMEGLAMHLAARGARVSGSARPDQVCGHVADRLRKAGVSVVERLVPEQVGGLGSVVWSRAVVGPHPELDAAVSRRVPVLARTHALALAGAGFGGGTLAAVWGSHSTATAAAALAHLLDDGRTGWILNTPALGTPAGHHGAARLVTDLSPDTGTHETSPTAPVRLSPGAVSRPTLAPAAMLITAVDPNSPHHEDLPAALAMAEHQARTARTLLVPDLSWWNKPLVFLRERLADRPGPQVVTVGPSSRCGVRISDLEKTTSGTYWAELRHGNSRFRSVVPATGLHHAVTVVCAAATALVLGEDPDALAQRLARFGGVEGSMQHLGTRGGVSVVRSRARHVTEVARDLQAAGELAGQGSVITVLEPDGYVRTRAQADSLGAALDRGHRAVLLPVAAGMPVLDVEDPLEAVAAAARKGLPAERVHTVRTGPCEQSAEEIVTGHAKDGDVVLVVGTHQAPALAERLLTRLDTTA